MKKYIRFRYREEIEFGYLLDDDVFVLKNNFLTGNNQIKAQIKFSDIDLLAPIKPSKIIALAYNYIDLVGEENSDKEPLIFLKSPTCIIGHKEKIRLPEKRKTWVEAELCIIVGKEAKNISPVNSHKYIFGYTIGNDVTMENTENRDHHLARSKSCDTFCPIGPWIVENLETSDLELRNEINGEIFQLGNTKNLIYNVDKSLSLVSHFMTLFPGDVILTGTPANAENSLIEAGDTISISIDKIGTLTNFVSI